MWRLGLAELAVALRSALEISTNEYSAIGSEYESPGRLEQRPEPRSRAENAASQYLCCTFRFRLACES